MQDYDLAVHNLHNAHMNSVLAQENAKTAKANLHRAWLNVVMAIINFAFAMGNLAIIIWSHHHR